MTEKTEHTSGPWTEHEKGEHPYAYVCGPERAFEFFDDKPVIAYVTGPSIPANRRLIAAAPDMLEALVRLVEAADGMALAVNSSMADEAIEEARTAIFKAEGRK